IKLPADLRVEASAVFLLFLAAFAVRWTFIVNRSLLFAAERIDLLSAEAVGVTLFQNASIVYVVLTHQGLAALALLHLASTVGATLLDMYWVDRFVLPWRHI